MSALQVREISDKTVWESFVRQFSPNNFLQSWNFGQFNAASGDTPLYLGVFEGEELIGTALFILTHARRGNYYAAAAAPLVQQVESRKSKVKSEGIVPPDVIPDLIGDPAAIASFSLVIQAFVDYLRGRSKSDNASFIRLRPGLVDSAESRDLFRGLKFRPAPMHLHAERTWMLDITPDEETLLSGMRKNTRYYVRRASKDGVTVRISQAQEDIEVLHRLQSETVSRQHFVPFSLSYFQQLFSAFIPDDQVAMVTADFEGQPISSAMINYYGDMAVYHYAASASAFQKIPSSYGLLWAAILEAKRRGCKWFNFWGVVGEDEPKHPWYGLSQFKRGFGGEEVNYLHAQDYPLSSRYWMTWAIERYRKWRRGL